MYLILLALQVAIQPTLTKIYIPVDINKTWIVLIQEVCKFVMSLTLLFITDGWNLVRLREFTIRDAILPASLYSLQNLAMLQASQQLDSVTFNVMNQTKTISAAVCCYLLLGKKQSGMQILAFIVLMVAACIIEGGNGDDNGIDTVNGFIASVRYEHFMKGVAPLLFASFISGLSGALTQCLLQSNSGKATCSGRNPFLFTLELCVSSMIVLGISNMVFYGGDFYAISLQSIPFTVLFPVVTNALGGIIVGLVTKHAGVVRKGFGIMIGIMLSIIYQYLSRTWALIFSTCNENLTPGVSKEQLVGCTLAIVSLYLHTCYPYVTKLECREKDTNGVTYTYSQKDKEQHTIES